MYGIGNISATLNDVLRPCNGLGKSEPYVAPYKTELKLMSRRFNRWSRNQVLWGKFVDALKKFIAPEDLMSKSFKTVVVYPVNDDVKYFEDIAQALDYAFDKGYRNKRNWLIINDKNKTVLSDSSIPKTLQGIIKGLYGVPSDSLGKPTIKLEFEDNAQLADFLKDNQPHYQYTQYTDVTASETSPNTATDAKANTRTNGKLMPAADSRTFPESPTASALPPTKTPPPLPPAPTAKALPPHIWTPLERQIKEIKKKYPDALLLFRVGDFFEAWGDDAITISIALNLPVTKRLGTSMIGIPSNALDKYLPNLVRQGYKVAICEQLEDANATNKIITKNGVLPVQEPPATNEPPVVKFTPKKPKQKEPEIEFDNVTYITRGMPAIIMDVPQSSISSKTYLNDWWNFVERKYHYPDDIVTFVQIEDKDNGTHYSKYYQFFFKNRDKDFVLRNIRNKKNVIFKDDFFIVTKLADIERIEDALLDDGNRHLVIIKPLIYDDGLGKPTIKLEFEDNADLMHLFDTDGISGLTVNDKPAAVFNCSESQLQTFGYKPTYKRLANYGHLIDTSDGAKTLKGYGFDSSTLDELLNACRQYRQVERLAAHLKDPYGDPLQSAFNVWHWLHTNIRYNYDTPGEEEIRTPARTWADRKSGVDCDCLAVMTACLLLNMGYEPAFEIVAFNGSDVYSHIYVNLYGIAIDRVLPAFGVRPANITKTKIMEIPVYELSGVSGCDTSLRGVYSSTLNKIQTGTATADDNNDYRKLQVLVTLKGIDDAAAKLATLLMPYVATVSDDGKYYFDSSNVATLAKKFDAELQALKLQGADDTMIQNWLSQVSTQLNNVATTADGEDTIVVIINPKGDLTNVSGKMVETDLQTLTPLTKTAVQQSNSAASETLPAIMQTSSAPATLTPDPGTESEEQNAPWWWLLGGMLAGFGIAAMSKNKKKTR